MIPLPLLMPKEEGKYEAGNYLSTTPGSSSVANILPQECEDYVLVVWGFESFWKPVWAESMGINGNNTCILQPLNFCMLGTETLTRGETGNVIKGPQSRVLCDFLE